MAINPLPTRSGKLYNRCCPCPCGNRRLCLRRVLDAGAIPLPHRVSMAGLAIRFSGVDGRVLLFPALAVRRVGPLQRGAEPGRPPGGQPGRDAFSRVRGQPKREAGPAYFAHRATDGGVRVNGRKQQIITDVERRIFTSFVHAANGHDGTAAALGLLPKRPGCGQRLVTVLTDNGYRGGFATHPQALGLRHELASRPPTARGFVPVAKRWMVEHTFA